MSNIARPIPPGKYIIYAALFKQPLGYIYERLMAPEPIVTLPPGVRAPTFTIETPEAFIPENPVYSIKTEQNSPLKDIKDRVFAITVYYPGLNPYIWKIERVSPNEKAAEEPIDGQLPEHEVYTVRITHAENKALWYLPDSRVYQQVKLLPANEPIEQQKDGDVFLPTITDTFKLIRVCF